MGQRAVACSHVGTRRSWENDSALQVETERTSDHDSHNWVQCGNCRAGQWVVVHSLGRGGTAEIETSVATLLSSYGWVGSINDTASLGPRERWEGLSYRKPDFIV